MPRLVMTATNEAETLYRLPKNGHEMSILLRAAYFALRRCGNAHFEQLDSNGDQFMILKLLADNGPINQLELVRRGGYDPSTATNILKTLERQGYVTRQPDPHDGRAKIVDLTNAGCAKQVALWKESAAVRRRLWKCVRVEDRQVVAETLQRFVSEMETLRSNVTEDAVSEKVVKKNNVH